MPYPRDVINRDCYAPCTKDMVENGFCQCSKDTLGSVDLNPIPEDFKPRVFRGILPPSKKHKGNLDRVWKELPNGLYKCSSHKVPFSLTLKQILSDVGNGFMEEVVEHTKDEGIEVYYTKYYMPVEEVEDDIYCVWQLEEIKSKE